MPLTAEYVSPDWYKSPQGQEIMASLLYRNLLKRKPFGKYVYMYMLVLFLMYKCTHFCNALNAFNIFTVYSV